MHSIDIVTFTSYQGQMPIAEYETLKIFVDRILGSYLGAKLTILTDTKTSNFLRFDNVHVIAKEVDKNQLLLERLRMYLDFLNTSDAQKIIFVDYDIIFNQSINWSVDDFDVAYTVRRSRQQPINGGLILVNNNEKSRRLFRQILDEYQNLPADDIAWWGDQKSIWSVLSKYEVDGSQIRVGDCLVRLIDAEKYNWTPFNMDVKPETLRENFFLTLGEYEEYLSKKVIHFKGPRKHLMYQFNRLQFAVPNHAVARNNATLVILKGSIDYSRLPEYQKVWNDWRDENIQLGRQFYICCDLDNFFKSPPFDKYIAPSSLSEIFFNDYIVVQHLDFLRGSMSLVRHEISSNETCQVYLAQSDEIHASYIFPHILINLNKIHLYRCGLREFRYFSKNFSEMSFSESMLLMASYFKFKAIACENENIPVENLKKSDLSQFKNWSQIKSLFQYRHKILIPLFLMSWNRCDEFLGKIIESVRKNLVSSATMAISIWGLSDILLEAYIIGKKANNKVGGECEDELTQLLGLYVKLGDFRHNVVIEKKYEMSDL